MATAREVIAESVGWYQDAGEIADAALAALDAQGLCVVAKADLREIVPMVRDAADYGFNQASTRHFDEMADRLDAALAAGGGQ